MSGTLQGNSLTMSNLPLAAPTDGLEAGVHLRWHFESLLGFPSAATTPGVFSIYRARHRDPSPSILASSAVILSSQHAGTGTVGALSIRIVSPANIAKTTIGPLTILKTAEPGKVTCKFSENICFAKVDLLSSRAGTATVTACDDDVELAVAQAPLSGSALKPVMTSIVVRADRFRTVEIAIPANTGIVSVSFYTPDTLNKQTDWKKIAGIGLPRSFAEAKNRLESSTVGRYTSGIADLVETAAKLMAGTAAETLTDASEDPGVSWNIDYTGLLLAASVDAPVARMVGLLYVDTEPAIVAGTNFYDYKIEATWNGVTYAWICIAVKAGTPRPLARPTGLTLVQTTAAPSPGTPTLGTTQAAVGITWDLPASTSGVLAPGSSIMYRIARAHRSGGTWSAPRPVTRAPVIPATQESGARASYFYTDGPLADAPYRYTIRGQDIFGRESADSASAIIDVADVTAPPPPQNVRASASEESSGTYAVSVAWDWTADMTKIAADISEFLVYYQTEGLQPVTGTTTSVTSGASSSVLETDLDPAADYSPFTPGTGSSYLHARGVRYEVTDIRRSGGKICITVNHAVVTTARGTKETRIPGSASGTSGADRSFLKYLQNPGDFEGSFMLARNWTDAANWQLAATKTASGLSATATITYRQDLSGIALTLSERSPVAYILVGVASRDASGNSGPVSTPAKVLTTWQGTSTASAFISSDTYATRADFYGHSYASMTFSAVPDLFYNVYRLSDSMLAAKAGLGTDPESVSDTQLLSWADSGTYDANFVKVDARDGNGQILADTSGFGQITYTDELPGATRNRFLYKVQSYAAGGTNQSALSGACLVKTYDVVAPRKPAITSVLGGDRAITITWRANTEGDMDHYELYRTTDASLAGDIRRMTAVSTAIAAATTSYADTVTGLVDYYYCLVAVDKGPVGDRTNGNVSLPAQTRARAYDLSEPATPVNLQAASASDGVTLTWESNDELVCAVLRAVGDSEDVSYLNSFSVSGGYDLGSGLWMYTYTDTTVQAGGTYTYSIKGRARNGKTTATSDPATVTV